MTVFFLLINKLRKKASMWQRWRGVAMQWWVSVRCVLVGSSRELWAEVRVQESCHREREN